MKYSRITYIFIALGIILISAYFTFSIFVFTKAENDILCNNFHVYFPGNKNLKLVTTNDILNSLTSAGLHPIGERYKNVNTDKIETELLKNKMLKTVECFKTPSGSVYLKVIQRQPKFMLAGAQCFYVDNDKEIMSVSLNHALYVPVVSGYITLKMAKGSLFDFIHFVSQSDFWSSQIEQVYVRPDKTIELIPRVGDALIYLGSLDNYKKKLKNLELLFTRGFTQIGWERYSIIDMQFDNQIVCTNKPQSKSEYSSN